MGIRLQKVILFFFWLYVKRDSFFAGLIHKEGKGGEYEKEVWLSL